jgi:hypothetical protein
MRTHGGNRNPSASQPRALRFFAEAITAEATPQMNQKAMKPPNIVNHPPHAAVDGDDFGFHRVGLLAVVGACLHESDEVADGDEHLVLVVDLAALGDRDPVEHAAGDVEFLVDDFCVFREECSGDLHVTDCLLTPVTKASESEAVEVAQHIADRHDECADCGPTQVDRLKLLEFCVEAF